MALDPISAKAVAAALPKTVAPAADAGAQAASGSFTSSLKQLLEAVDDSASDANSAVNGMVTGTGDVHHAMLALQKAETMLQLTVQVRNKLVQAYQDVMRMPV
jgi:flagellar hook-basal body complex protein FliE